jgi:hypothetical protein
MYARVAETDSYWVLAKLAIAPIGTFLANDCEIDIPAGMRNLWVG